MRYLLGTLGWMPCRHHSSAVLEPCPAVRSRGSAPAGRTLVRLWLWSWQLSAHRIFRLRSAVRPLGISGCVDLRLWFCRRRCMLGKCKSTFWKIHSEMSTDCESDRLQLRNKDKCTRIIIECHNWENSNETFQVQMVFWWNSKFLLMQPYYRNMSQHFLRFNV